MEKGRFRFGKTDGLHAALYFVAFFVIFTMAADPASLTARTEGRAALGAAVCAVLMLLIGRRDRK